MVGNSAYQNVTRLDNPSNDATLMADTLAGLGFTLVGDGPQLDLDKAALDIAVQNFGRPSRAPTSRCSTMPATACKSRGANYLVPVGANPTARGRRRLPDGRRQPGAAPDAGRRHPAQPRDPRRLPQQSVRRSRLARHRRRARPDAGAGGHADFLRDAARQRRPGRRNGNSPYTKALAATIRKSGLDIFQTFNQVGLAVKRLTGGSQQPWVSISPIDGNFYFVAPVPTANAPAVAATDYAAQAWAATRDTTSLAVIEAFIQEYGGSIYGPFARASRDELKNGQIALVTAERAATRPAAPRLTRADVVNLFEPFNQTMARVRKSYIEKRYDKDLMVAANTALQRAFPPQQQVSSAGQPELRSGATSDAVYDTALAIMNEQPTNSEDSRIVGVAINGALASLDPHSSYMHPTEYADMQT